MNWSTIPKTKSIKLTLEAQYKDGKPTVYTLRLTRNRRQVAFASFRCVGSKAIRCGLVLVSKAYRRRGLAWDLWTEIVNVSGLRMLKPRGLTRDGAAFWEAWRETNSVTKRGWR